MPEAIVHLLPLLVAAALIVPLAIRLGLGTIVGYILAGLVVGPGGLGLVRQDEEIHAISELGVVALLFVIGLELRPARLWSMRRYVFVLGTAQVVLSGLIIAFAVRTFGLQWPAAAVIGGALALSSTAFVGQILREQGSLGTRPGQAALGVLLLQDLAIVPLLAAVPLLAGETAAEGGWGIAAAEALAALALVLVAGRYIANPLLRLGTRGGSAELLPLLAVLITLGSATLTAQAGMSAGLGAFLAGLLLNGSEFRHQLMAEVQPYRSLLLGLFFMGVGLSFDLDLMLQWPGRIIAATVLFLALKIVILAPLARAARLGWGEAAGLGLLLAQGGEFGLVLAAAAVAAGVLEPTIAQGVAMVIALSMAATPWLASAAQRLQGGPERVGAEPPPAEFAHEQRVLVAGFGRVGGLVAEALEEAGVAWVGLDLRGDRVRQARERGLPVYFGDAARSEVLVAVGAAHAPAIVLTMDNPAAMGAALTVIRQRCPGVPVLTRAQDVEWATEFAGAGAAAVVSEMLEVGLELAAEALTRRGLPREAADRTVHQVRRRYAMRGGTSGPEEPETRDLAG